LSRKCGRSIIFSPICGLNAVSHLNDRRSGGSGVSSWEELRQDRDGSV
jgi:hypothetical protein